MNNPIPDLENKDALRRNVFISILLPSLIPLIVLSGVILFQFKQAFQDKVEDYLAELVQKHQQNIDGFLRERLADIEFIATSFSYEQLQDKQFLRSELRRLQNIVDDVYVDMGFVNEQGRQVAYAGPYQLDGAEYQEADWFLEALNQETSISDVFLGKRGFPHFIVTVRKETESGRSWILRATIDFGYFNALVRRTRIGKSGFVFLMNTRGRFQTQAVQNIEPDKPPYSEFIKTPTDSGQVLEGRDQRGRKTLFVLSRLEMKDWLLVGQHTSREAFAELYTTIWIAVIILLVGGGSVAATAHVLSSRISRRVHLMQQEKEAMNVQVVETGKMAAIGELAAGIAHEINNPVAIMLEEAGWIGDLLSEEKPDAVQNRQEIERALQEIRTQGRRSKDITHKLLSFARKTDSRIQDVDLRELIDELMGICAQKAKYSQVSISTDIAPDVPLIQASPSELQQVFLNLINNAVDAMEKEGGTLDIQCWYAEGRILLRFTDSGPGIPPGNLRRIFEPFFTTKPVGKGTGLGLSICQGIIEKMNGSIQVESEPGKGTVFSISLPVAGQGHENTKQETHEG